MSGLIPQPELFTVTTSGNFRFHKKRRDVQQRLVLEARDQLEFGVPK